MDIFGVFSLSKKIGLYMEYGSWIFLRGSPDNKMRLNIKQFLYNNLYTAWTYIRVVSEVEVNVLTGNLVL